MTYFLVLQFTFFTSANGLIRLCHDRSLDRRTAVIMERDITSNHTYTHQQSAHPGQSAKDKLSCSYGTAFCSTLDNMHYTALSCCRLQAESKSERKQQATDVGLSLSLLSHCLKKHDIGDDVVTWKFTWPIHHISRAGQCSW